MANQKFFQTTEVLSKLTAAAGLLAHHHDTVHLYRLGEMLQIIVSNAAEFDDHCQYNIRKVSPRLMEELAKIQPVQATSRYDLLSVIVYRFVVEYDLSIKNEVSMEVRAFLSQVEGDTRSMNGDAKLQVEYARQNMPIAILKAIMNSDEFGNLRNVTAVASSVEQKVTEWEGRLQQSETNADRLGTLLEKQTSAFNFVGLHQGFADLSTSIAHELRSARIGISIFGVLVLLPGLFDLWLALGAHQDFSTLPTYTLLAAGIGTLTLTLLFLYFFRIALRKADSCRAQLMQVRLRMSLCKFIQSYADYSKGIRENNPDALSKFEALIFSGIVGTEDKLPSTFDGIEQLSALAKSIRGQG